MKQIVVVAALAAALAGAAWADEMMSGSSSSSSSDANSMMAPADNSMTAPNAMAGSGSMMASDMSYDTLKKQGKLADVRMGMQLRAAMSSGMKVTYKDLMSAEKLAGSGPTVLFFAADWCPYCQADLKDINMNGSRLGGITVVVVDYDKAADLKKKYAVTEQDTFVQIGPMGEKLAAWNGGGVTGILDKVQKPM